MESHGFEIEGTKDYGLELKGPTNQIEAFSDADFAKENDRKSRSGIIAKIGQSVVTWKSKKQKTVALSTVEAEYVAGALGAQELIWIQQLYDELEINYTTPVLWIDNQGALALSKNPTKHSKTKHVSIKEHFIRDTVNNGKIKTEYCRTDEMEADILTKPLGRKKFIYFREKFGLVGKSNFRGGVKDC